MANPIPPPTTSPLVDSNKSITWDWLTYFVQSIAQPLAKTGQQTGAAVNRSGTTAASAAIPATPFTTGALNAGLYRINGMARVTVPAATSSSLSVSIGFSRAGVPCTVTTDPLTSNTIASVLPVLTVINADTSSPITYATTYASVGSVMTYELALSLEALA